MQSRWDFCSIFMHEISKKSCRGIGSVSEIQLSVKNLLKALISSRKDNKTFVFHAQSSLPFLFTCRIFLFFFRLSNVNLVYDVHDFHERKKDGGFFRQLRYYWFRYEILRCLERFAVRSPKVSVITVSGGLAKMISESYGCPIPKVVMSAHGMPIETCKVAEHSTREFEAVYFGIAEHAPPIDVVQELICNGISLHIYGRGMSEGFYPVEEKYAHLISYLGEYDPADLSFLMKYRYLILYKPEVLSVNYKVALPNKMFQGMAAGLFFVISPNFEEMKNVLSVVPGSTYVLSNKKEIVGAIQRFEELKYVDYVESLVRCLSYLVSEARSNYLSVTKGLVLR
ncbi:hypothetical protein [Marinobacter nauticus]|uniref:hypothetical protein n=1 Tax=Marinobacter nauticus TaxID=2743 RepID=UPI001C99115D|nr:hypothetical protein [Marinobacter nauticus]MBY5954874.1 hypothetical protein [Marinobacter nauticus]MBY6008667.1 hypothetical protein [Marinobacter nauticus]